MKRYIFSFLLLGLFTSFTNGVWIGKLTCKSLSGRTLFEAELEDMSILNSAKFVVDKTELNFKHGDKCFVIFDPKNKVFTINLESDTKNIDSMKFVEFWAIPSSFEEIEAGDHSTTSYKFNASIRAKDPRKNKDYATPTIFLDCRLDYHAP